MLTPNEPVLIQTRLVTDAQLCLDLLKKNALPFGYKHLMWHLILTTCPWSILTWITLHNICNLSPFVIIFLTEVFEGILLSKILLPFPWNPYLKTDVTSLLILFFKEKEVEFLTEWFLQKLSSKRWYICNKWALLIFLQLWSKFFKLFLKSIDFV